ncbi:hypothetical protein Vadar_001358 [Vaccinium darrowii]|uniref:Uncharacterized protein n=1 Tax=Vaccinium darrowii TaxID=229202 RepID=A0ACB7Z8N4_9ERIC|nr:hypothetical protein Vadar_001358 [Vaccinium darrowii]
MVPNGSMRFMCWNVQGVGRPLTFHQLKEFSRLHSPSLFFLSETKNGVTRMQVVKRALGMDGSLWVDPTRLAGGLAVFWKGTNTVKVMRVCSWFIDIQVNAQSGTNSWRLVNVYFSSRPKVRKDQWEAFLHYKQCLGEDWVLWGDMNCIISSDEKRGGLTPLHSTVRGFKDFIDQCQLLDLGFTGYPFTWRNNRDGEGQIQERLDRALASPFWRTKFSQATIEHVNAVGSDHSALILHLNPYEIHRRAPFRFDARWVQEEEVDSIVKTAWATSVPGSWLFKVHHRIEECRCSLLNWKKRKRDNSDKNITVLKENIQQIHNSPFRNRERLKELEGQLQLEWDSEELFWKQKSRVDWLQHGDKNTGFFHASVLQRRAKNRITGVEDSNSNWISDSTEVKTEFQRYYQSIFEASPALDMGDVLSVIPTLVDAAMN